MGFKQSSNAGSQSGRGTEIRKQSKAFFPRVSSSKILIHILDCLHPHEIIAIEHCNTFIYDFVADDMVWMRLTSRVQRMHLCTPNSLVFFYPEAKVQWVKMPLKVTSPLPAQYTSVETKEHRLFFLGGLRDIEDRKSPSAEVYEYLERKGRVISKERMTEERYNCHVALRQNEIYVMGGENGKEHLLNCEKYVISDNIWISLAFLIGYLHKGVLYATDELIYHLEPTTENSLSLYTYACNDNTWEVKAITLPSELKISSINFCESGRTSQEVLLFTSTQIVNISIDKKRVIYDKKKGSYPEILPMSGASHMKVANSIYALNEKHFLWAEDINVVKVLYNYTFESAAKLFKSSRPPEEHKQ